MAEKRLDIIIKAKNEVDSGFEAARSKVMENLSKLNVRSVNLAAGFTVISNATQVMTAAFKGGHAVLAMFKGDWDSFKTVTEQLPFGIGGAVKAGNELWAMLSGTAERAKKAKEEIAAMQEKMADMEQRGAASKQAIDALDKIRERVLDNAAIELAANKERERALIEYRKQIEELNNLFDAQRATGFTNEADFRKFRETEQELKNSLERKLKMIADKESEEGEKQRQKVLEEEKKQADKEAEEARKQQEKEIEEEKKHARRLEDLDMQIMQKRLAAQGEADAAALLAKAKYYDDMIALAADAGERERLEFLKTTELQEMASGAGGGAGGKSVYRGVAAVGLTNELTGISEQFAQNMMIENMQAGQQAQASRDHKRDSLLQRVVELLDSMSKTTAAMGANTLSIGRAY